MTTAAAAYQIADITDSREFPTKYGPMKAYDLVLNDGSMAELKQKPETPAPQRGDEIFGTITESDRGLPRFKKMNPEYASRERAPVSYGSAPTPAQRASESIGRAEAFAEVAAGKHNGLVRDTRDTRQEMIVRQSCQKVAATLTHIQGQGFDKTRFKELVDWLQADAEGLRPSQAEAPPSEADEEIPF